MPKACCGHAASSGSQVYCAMQDHCVAVSRWWWSLCNRLKSSDYSSRRILVADDEESILKLVTYVIEDTLGCHVFCVSNGDDAIACLEAEPYDVFITDMVMPGINGFDLLTKARELWPDTDIIVMTGLPQDFPYVKVINTGAKDFLSKPHQADELEAKLVRIFQEQDIRDAQLLAETKYRSIFEFNMNGMLLLDPDGYRIADVNEAFCLLSGVESDRLLGMSFLDLLDPFEKKRMEQALELFASGGQGTLGDLLLVRPDDKRELNLDVSVTFINALSERVVFLAFKDVTEKREVERQLAEVAQTDQLTGLANKYTFHTRLEWAIARARSEKFDITLLELDLDNFKECNDTYGHLIGDDVLATVGEVIRKNIRTGGDEGFRYGGDEFAVLLMGATPDVGERVARRMVEQFEGAENYGTSLSIGIAAYKNGMHANDLVRLADEAMYQVKASGKNGIRLAEHTQDIPTAH